MADDIKFYLSGGASNKNPFLSNGGEISTTELVDGMLNNLWPDVSESQAQAGVTDHKIIYVKNVSGGALANCRAFFGETDNYTGMALTTSTVKNQAIAFMENSQLAVLEYWAMWDNSPENVSTFQQLNATQTKLVQYISDCNFPAYNQYIDKVDITLAKQGSPTGTATVRVWREISGSAAAAAVSQIMHGCMPDAACNEQATSSNIANFNNLAKKKVAVVYFSDRWDSSISFPTSQANACKSNGAVPFIRMHTGEGTTPFANNADIIAGDVDSQLNAYADACKSFGTTIVCQYGVEVNGDWMEVSKEGSTAYKNAYKHIINLFRARGVTNVIWAFQVDVTDNTSSPDWYPGDDYIDFVGTSCYGNSNGETGDPLTGSLGYGCIGSLRAGGYNRLKAITSNKPLGIFEWGIGESEDTQDTLQNLPTEYPDIILIQVWNEGSCSGTEWSGTIDVNSANLSAYQNGIANNIYTYAFNLSPGEGGGEPPAPPAPPAGVDVVRTLGTIDVATLTTSPVKHTFDTITENVTGVLPGVGWRIGIEYSGGSSSNYVKVFTSPVTASTNKGGWVQYWASNKWNDLQTLWLVMIAYTNHGPCFQTPSLPPPGSGDPGTPGGGGGCQAHGYSITSATDNGNDGNVAANAIDGNLATRWSQNSADAQLTLDMGASHTVTAVKIAWYNGDQRQANFTLSYSTNGSSYTNIGSTRQSSGTSNALEEFGFTEITARYIKYTGTGNSVNTWNSITEIQIWGTDAYGTNASAPPAPTGALVSSGSNPNKPTSYETGIVFPTLNNNDYIGLTLERKIPPYTGHSDTENYSIVIANDPNIQQAPEEPGQAGEFGYDSPLPWPPGLFDPGIIVIPDITPPGGGQDPCQVPPGDTNPPPDDGGPGGPNPPGSPGDDTTPDGIQMPTLPTGYAYSDHHQGPNENFRSDGSFRLDKGVQPALNEVNLVVYLNLASGSDEISGKLAGGTHTDSKAKNGRCYDIGVNQAGDRVRIRKEDPHPDTISCMEKDMNLGSLNGKWVGFQFLKWNEGDTGCHIQVWIDASGSTTPTNRWQKVLDEVDTGQWFEEPYFTVYDSTDSQTTIRVDGMSDSKFDYKFFDAVRIVHQ